MVDFFNYFLLFSSIIDFCFKKKTKDKEEKEILIKENQKKLLKKQKELILINKNP